MRGLFITGTDTGVGKTWIACLVARALTRQGIHVVPRKPVESGCCNDAGQLIAADALKLMQAADYTGSRDEVCRWCFEAAISPQRAARLMNRPLTTRQLTQACCTDLDSSTDFLLVEGAGGFYSPLCEDGLNADLAERLGLPLLLVADDRLGCINQVLLNLHAMQSRQLSPLAVILNRPADTQSEYAPMDMDNANDLRQRLPCPVFTAEHGIETLPDALTSTLLNYFFTGN